MQLRDILRGPTALLLASMAALTAACGTTSPPADPGVMTTPQSPAVGSDSPVVSSDSPAGSTAHPTGSTAPPADGALTSTPSSPSYSPGSAGGSEGTATTKSAGDDGTRTAVPTEAGTGVCAGGRALIDEVAWVEIDQRASLEVVPSDLLRDCALAAVDDLAWAEVLELQPDADTPGMVEQFTCHVLFAPRKQEWHLEPWRPVVDGREMIATRCNPGGADPDLG